MRITIASARRRRGFLTGGLGAMLGLAVLRWQQCAAQSAAQRRAQSCILL